MIGGDGRVTIVGLWWRRSWSWRVDGSIGGIGGGLVVDGDGWWWWRGGSGEVEVAVG